jgi:Fe-S-cluster containining protein
MMQNDPRNWNAGGLPPLKCGGCTACCRGDTVALCPADNPSAYKTKAEGGRLVLAKGSDGNCVYLGKSGCKIHHRKPFACRMYDCRLDYRMSVQQGQAYRLAGAACQRGRELLTSHDTAHQAETA